MINISIILLNKTITINTMHARSIANNIAKYAITIPNLSLRNSRGSLYPNNMITNQPTIDSRSSLSMHVYADNSTRTNITDNNTIDAHITDENDNNIDRTNIADNSTIDAHITDENDNNTDRTNITDNNIKQYLHSCLSGDVEKNIHYHKNDVYSHEDYIEYIWFLSTEDIKEHGEALIEMAILTDNTEAIYLIFNRGYRHLYTCHPRINNYTYMHAAAKNGNIGQIEMLANQSNILLNIPNDCGYTPLMLAAEHGHVDAVDLIIKLGGHRSIDKGHYFDQRTAMHFAADEGHVEVVRILLSHHSKSVNSVDRWGYTPLFCASQNGHVDVVNVLMDNNCTTIDQRNVFNVTPLFAAVEHGHVSVVETLMARGCTTINTNCYNGITPMHMAIKRGDSIMISKLYDLGSRSLHPSL